MLQRQRAYKQSAFRVSGGLDACCTGLGIVARLTVPVTFPEFGASRLGGAAFANDGAGGGCEDFIIGRLPVITFGLGFAGGTGAVAFFAMFFGARVEGLRLRLSLRAALRGALIVVFRFAPALRLRSLLGGTSFMVASFSRRARFSGAGGHSLPTGMRRGGSNSCAPKIEMERREPVSIESLCRDYHDTHITSTSFECP